jgi:hypothetical protein
MPLFRIIRHAEDTHVLVSLEVALTRKSYLGMICLIMIRTPRSSIAASKTARAQRGVPNSAYQSVPIFLDKKRTETVNLVVPYSSRYGLVFPHAKGTVQS